MKILKIIPVIQIFYFLITALWPFVHLRSFLEITGPKTDIWLVKTVSLLLLPYCLLVLYITEIRRSMLVTLAVIIGCLGLAGIDLYFYLNGTIEWVYMIDFVLEVIFVIYWLSFVIEKLRSTGFSEKMNS